MAFIQCWRWFGPADPIALREIRQTGASGIVTALHEVPAGEVWTLEAIRARQEMVRSEGLEWVVAESLPVHEEIKRGGAHASRYLESYRASLGNLGACGIRVVCYNFMPVLDWSRTDLAVRFADGSLTTGFRSHILAAFDLFLLKRPGAEKEYSPETRRDAGEYFAALSPDGQERLARTILLGLPGSGEAYTLDELRAAIAQYAGISPEQFRATLSAFLRTVVPAAEEAGVRLAIHPDDPPWPMLGLPRVVSTAEDVSRILAEADSPANGITLCTGSLGASRRTNVAALAARFARRVNFVHLRNVAATAQGDFTESDHLEGDVDMYAVIRTLLLEQRRRAAEGREDARLPMRPDHGRLMSGDRRDRPYYPGYSLMGRMRALAELRGLEAGIERTLEP